MLPLGIVVYMPCGAAFLVLMGVSLLDLNHIPITIAILIKLLIVSAILAIAAPPIPGSAFVVMPILFKACSIPDSGYALAIIMGSTIGYLLPAFNGFLLQLEVLMTSLALDKVDQEALKKPYGESA